MTITEFHQAVIAALSVEPETEVLQDLAGAARHLADQVGWADGIIAMFSAGVEAQGARRAV